MNGLMLRSVGLMWLKRQPYLLRASRMSTQEILKVDVIESKKGVGEIRMQRPPVNSLDRAMLTGLTDGIQQLEKDGCRAVMVTSAIPGIFSAGLNLPDLYKQSGDSLHQFWTMVQDMFLTLYGTDLITVACITGAAPAAGSLISTSCDYRVMTDHPKTVIGLNEALIGLPVPDWMRLNFTDVVGTRRSQLALQMAQLLPGQQALSVGLVDELADSADAARQQALNQLDNFLRVPDVGRIASKREHTAPLLEYVRSRRSEDARLFAERVGRADVQAVVGKYLAALSKKGAK